MSSSIEVPQLATLGTGYSVKATVQRHVTDDETVCFEGIYMDSATAEMAVTKQLALCRDHMAKYNAEVRLVDQAKADELDKAIQEKGDVVKKLTQEIAQATATLEKSKKRLQVA